MSKNRKQKLFIFVILTVLLSFFAVGCGKKADDGFDPDAIAYLAAYHEVDFGSGYSQSMMVQGDYLYVYLTEWIESEMRNENKLLEISITDGSVNELPMIDLADNEWVSNQGMVVNSAGNILLLASSWSEDGNLFSLYEATFSGEQISKRDISEVLTLGQESWLQGMYADKQDNLYFVVSNYSMYNSTYELYAFDKDMKQIGKIDSPNYIENLFISNDGKVYITGWFENGMAMREADFPARSFGPDITFSGLGRYGNMRFSPGGPTGILCSDGSNLMACDIETGTATVILDWIEADVNANDVRFFGQLDNGKYWLLNQIWRNNSTKTELIALTETTYGALPKREYITFAAMYVDYALKGAIIDFNKTNDKYRIRIKEYYDYSSEESWESAVTRFNTDLTGRNIPDLIGLSNINFHHLAAKNVFQDLNPYFDKGDVNRADYLENVLNAYDIDGKLFGVMSSFSVSAMVGHASKLNGITQWDVEQMIAWAEQYPDAMLMNTTATSIMYTMVYSVLDRFVDWETGKCYFDGDEFIRIMEFAATFSDEWDDWNNPDRIGTYTGLSEGYHLLSEQNIYELNSMQLVHALFDGDEQYIGYPVETGSGIMLVPQSTLGISAKSKHKDGAFAFISYLLSDTCQMPEEGSWNYGLPVKLTAFDAMIEMESTPPEHAFSDWGDGLGLIERSSRGYGFDDFSVDIYYSKNKEFIDTFKDLVSRADGIRAYDESMNAIIQEETQSFFAGQKSAREVAEIIQNRVQVYVNENR